MKTNNEFSKDLPTLRRELTDVLPKSGVLKRTLDMETIVDDGVTVLIWLGELIGIAFMIFEGYLFFGLSGITSTGLAAYFRMLFLVVAVAVLRPIPLVWEGAVLVKIGLSFYRAIIRQRLLADFQRDPETLQVGIAYAINAENDVIIQPTESKHSFQQAINTLTKEQHQQWGKMTSSRVSDNFGDHKATGYDAVAIKKFLQTYFSDEFVFVDVLLKRFSKPFYWQVTQASEGVVFYFQKGRHHYYLLDNIDATGMRKKGVATSFVQRLFSHKRRHA